MTFPDMHEKLAWLHYLGTQVNTVTTVPTVRSNQGGRDASEVNMVRVCGSGTPDWPSKFLLACPGTRLYFVVGVPQM